MTPDRFRRRLEAFHWSHRDIADILGLDDRTTRRWASGAYPIPPDVAVWLEGLMTWLHRNPAPRRPEVRQRALDVRRSDGAETTPDAA